MNYIDLINRFWDMDLEHSYSPYETKLYFAILNVANRLRWKEPISVPNSRLTAMVGCEKKTLIRARQRLVDTGLLFYASSSTRKAGRYWWNKATSPETNSAPNPGTHKEPIAAPYLRQYETGQDQAFSKRHPKEYEKLHLDLRGVIDFYELSVKAFEVGELPFLLRLNDAFTAGQIRSAIQKFSQGNPGKFRESGIAYIEAPLRKGLFGREKNGRHRPNCKEDAVKGPKFENGPDLSGIVITERR